MPYIWPLKSWAFELKLRISCHKMPLPHHIKSLKVWKIERSKQLTKLLTFIHSKKIQ